MKIIQVNSLLSGGGTDDQCLKLSFGLQELGGEVIVAGPADAELSQLVLQQRMPLHGLARSKAAFFWGLLRLLQRVKPQIVHVHHGRDYWPTVLACRLSGIKTRLVATRHLAKSPSSWLSKHQLLRQCDAFVAVSEFVARVLREGIEEPESPVKERRSRPPMHGPKERIKVIHGGIDLEKFQAFDATPLREQWGLKPGQLAFAVVGAYDFPVGKGQREFLQATALIHNELPQARFLIIGRGTMHQALQDQIRDSGLQEKAWLTPYSHQMPTAMNAIDCLVHPAQGTEAFGLVLIEAFACGKPVIATRLDGVPEAFAAGGYGQLIDSLDPQSLAEAMRQVAANRGQQHPPDHQRLAATFSLQTMSKNYWKLYQELVP